MRTQGARYRSGKGSGGNPGSTGSCSGCELGGSPGAGAVDVGGATCSTTGGAPGGGPDCGAGRPPRGVPTRTISRQTER